MRVSRGTFALVAFTLFVANAAFASEGPPPMLNVKTYTSPAGEFALEVDPSTMYGQGEAAYRLTHSGKEVWAAKHPFTFWEAVVADDGTVAGYAYQYGWRGFPAGGRRADPKSGKFYVAIFAPDGKPRRVDETDREDRRFLHDAPNPLATGVFTDANRRHVIVQLRNPDVNAGGERWRVFDLATGDNVANVDAPRPDDSARSVIDVRPVQDTPLVLVHWWYVDRKGQGGPGGAFALVDLSDPRKPAEAWRLLLPGDYATDAGRDLADDAIIRCDQARRFDLHFVVEKKRVTFEATPGPEGLGGDWVVKEVAREPYAPKPAVAQTQPAEQKLPEVALKSLGEVKLAVPAPPVTQPVCDVRTFDIDDRGRIGFVRGEKGDGGGCSFVLVDADGKPVVDVTPLPPDTSQAKVAWLAGERWVVTDDRPGHDKESRARFVDVDMSKGRASLLPVEKFEASSVESLCSTRDGGFAALCVRRHQYSSTDELYGYDKSAGRRWMIAGHSGNNSILFSPKAVAFDPTGGSVVVLENIRNKLQLISPHGELKRTIDLKQSFGKEPNYVTDVAVTSGGTFVIHDFRGSPPVWRLKNDGTLLDRFEPKFPDGRKVEIRDIRIGPKDSLWASDGSMLVRLDAKGVVDLALGATPGADAAEDAGAVAFGKNGEIYLASSRGGAVRVFDSSAGKLLRTLKPDPGDFGSNTHINRLIVDGGGNVYVAGWDGPYLRLKSDGTRGGWEKQSLDSIKEQWAFQPGTRKRWVAGYHNLWIVDADGKPIRETQRQPDRQWLGHPEAMAVAPDGSLALSANAPTVFRRQDSRLNFYSPTGEPVRTISLSDAKLFVRLAFDGRRAVIAQLVDGGTELFLASMDDGSLKRLTLDGKTSLPDGRWEPAFSPDGRELWLINLAAKEKSIRRFALGS